MKIQNINNFMGYNKSNKPVKNDEKIKVKNYDVIDIKKTSVENDSKISKVKQDVASQINAETSAEKIQKIRDSLNNKTYSIDADEIANKLMK